MELVDTHCHIQSAGLERGERGTRELWAKDAKLTADSMIGEAATAGVSRMLCVGCDLEDSRLAIDFASQRSNCWATIGIHPHEAKHFASRPDKLDEFAATLQKIYPRPTPPAPTTLDSLRP